MCRRSQSFSSNPVAKAWTKDKGKFVFTKIKEFRKGSDGVIRVINSPAAKAVVGTAAEAVDVATVPVIAATAGMAAGEMANEHVDRAREAYGEGLAQQYQSGIPAFDRENADNIRELYQPWKKP